MDLIDRQAAIDAFDCSIDGVPFEAVKYVSGYADKMKSRIKALPSVEPEQTKMIKEIREWINSGNRGSADYFIVDKIEEIINKYDG